tara:strand:+ start:84 stop:332 length:249 start_codon:yes stop_codon:yes gene_type:complete
MILKPQKEYDKKKKAWDQASWMNQDPQPLPRFSRGQSVQVYRGAGWSKAVVENSSRSNCTVRIAQGNQIVRVYDRRCIRPAK